ncbi:H(+)-transporting V1 sector ATPase subunit G SCDLUD_004604, partial [Saccharomycodes ludwigii]
SQSNGIATLLKTEKDAQKIVAEARQYRQDKLKQAKKDALDEIQKYKTAKEQELKDFEAKNAGSVGDLEKSAEQGIQGDLKEIQQQSNAKKNDVVNLLVGAVTKPSAEIHINAK